MLNLAPIFFCLVATGFPSASGQTFTRITEGALVNDGGASRSVNWIDVNSDGYCDLFVSNGLETGEDNFLYINNGPDSNFTFRKVSGDPIVEDHAKSDGSSWADIDNDGDIDAFVVNWYNDDNLMYRNNGDGTFEQELTDIAVNDAGYSETCCWGDIDNDGDVDLYVTNSGSPTIGAKANFLYLNDGSGAFDKVTTGEIVTDLFYSRGATMIDYDEDGDLDVFVANERNQANNLYQNLLQETGGLTFQRVAGQPVVTDLASSWSGSWGDFDNDGDQDLFVANGWPNGQNDFLYTNSGDGTFVKVATGPVVSDASFSSCGAWGDYDNDGDLDLFVTTAYSGSPTANRLYQNMLQETGAPEFERRTDGSIANDAGDSYGCAWEDYNNDGFLDMFVARTQNENQDNLLYRNDASNGNRWLRINLVGTVSNRTGIGAKVSVKGMIGGQEAWQERVVSGQTGYCGQSITTHFGTGDALVIDSLMIEWPSGIVDIITGQQTNTILSVTEGATLSVDEGTGDLPEILRLYQNYPNPFNPSTTIRYRLEETGKVVLRVTDLLGKLVSILVDRTQTHGTYEVDLTSHELPSTGVYRYVLSSGGHEESRWLVFLK